MTERQKYIVLMVEPRKSENFDIVMSSLPKDLWLYFFGTKSNKKIVTRKAKQHGIRLKFQLIPQKFLGSETYVKYNEYFKSELLWTALDDAEWVFVAQTDMALCDGFKGNGKEFDKYTKFPYIGCAYAAEEGSGTFWADTYPDAAFYGVGGMSLRNLKFTLECIRDLPHKIDGKDIPEDVFFSTCLHKKKNKLKPSTKDMHQFCIESDYSNKYMHNAPIGPLGVHKPNLIDTRHKDKLHAKCPIAFQLDEDSQKKKKETFSNPESEWFAEINWNESFDSGGIAYILFYLSSWIVFGICVWLKMGYIPAYIISIVYFFVGAYFFSDGYDGGISQKS